MVYLALLHGPWYGLGSMVTIVLYNYLYHVRESDCVFGVRRPGPRGLSRCIVLSPDTVFRKRKR